ncbi:SDR family NAD(P)-dependent oxidoreductase [Haloplanus halophilus]|uniref:SDR family NAD(P)-dependent oxidoreductase n=1 Tax=Haloplanus halophilus TaxID=2949993 RepID=UPI00203B2B8F|nr:SDR family oxidoreductase [Haloplanus sp. GDY1]
MENVDYDFDGDTVVVTGASSGIGREIALMFAEAGATVLNADIEARPDHVETATHDAIEEAGGTGEYVDTDVSDPEALDDLIDRAGEYGGVDVMVNNAGANIRKSVLEVTPDDFDSVSGVNLGGVIFGTQKAAEDMIERGTEGCIVNTVSVRARVALDNQIMYNATKGGVRMVTRSTALELADHDIRVNGIAPGRTITGLSDTTREAEEMAESGDLVKPIPLGGPAYPEDIAPTALYVASDAADYMTGEIVYVDGGWSIY